VRTEDQLAAAQLAQRRQRAHARPGVIVDLTSMPTSRIEAER
jgi:hypothetical protein